MTDLYLSPHFDDVVLSCGGRLWAQRAARACVVTLCAAAPPTDGLSPFARELHARWGDPPHVVALRRAEDCAALTRLGVLQIVQLDFQDCIYRQRPDGTWPYASEEALFGALDPYEAPLVTQIADALEPYLPVAGAGCVWAPLGIGRHVDHQLGYAVAQRLMAQGVRVGYYEDLPYAARPGWLDAVLALCDAWRSELVPLDEEALLAKVDAMAYYRSQIGALFGDSVTMGAVLRGYSAGLARGEWPYAERVWYPPGVN